MFSVAEDCVLCSLPLQQLQLSAEALGRSFLSSLMGSGNSLYNSTSVSWAGREAVTAGPGWLHVLRCRGAGPTVEGPGGQRGTLWGRGRRDRLAPSTRRCPLWELLPVPDKDRVWGPSPHRPRELALRAPL